ncbi:hypothetical protein EZS27_016067 [termite gut metagenome]|uniref:DUF5119 domain-containing protein n=1 Tax=termite gut metagenome TaxID=433724 RepID=A0A5J4RQ00_9ZZZZ
MKITKNIAMIMAVFICLSSCVIEVLHDTDHPDHGRVNLVTDWSNRGEDIDIPANYTVMIGDEYTTTLSGASNAVDYLFPVGAYHVNIYNSASKIIVSGATATADYSAFPIGGWRIGWFFTGVQDGRIEQDKDHTITVQMQQQIRQLNLTLELTGDAKERIIDVQAVLSGIAASIDVNTGNSVGDAVNVIPVFTKQTNGNYTAPVRLLGTLGNTQTLTVTLFFASGHPSTLTIVSDLSGPLAAFNANKKTPLTLSSVVLVTPTAGGFTATIEDWTNSNGYVIVD